LFEDLQVAGMLRNCRLTRAISDAGWGQFVRPLQEKAERLGHTVVMVSRWLPTDLQRHLLDAVSAGCQSTHDRDPNAALNILAAGRAERQNACGARVSPPSGQALGDKAGSTPDAA
jgi:putative transposase